MRCSLDMRSAFSVTLGGTTCLPDTRRRSAIRADPQTLAFRAVARAVGTAMFRSFIAASSIASRVAALGIHTIGARAHEQVALHLPMRTAAALLGFVLACHPADHTAPLCGDRRRRRQDDKRKGVTSRAPAPPTTNRSRPSRTDDEDFDEAAELDEEVDDDEGGSPFEQTAGRFLNVPTLLQH